MVVQESCIPVLQLLLDRERPVAEIPASSGYRDTRRSVPRRQSRDANLVTPDPSSPDLT